MKKFTCFIVLCFLIFITGCNSVFTTHPMGDSPLKINAVDWDGTWINKGGSVVVKVTNPEKGHLIAALIKSSKDDLILEKYDIEIRGSNDFVLINIKNKEEKDKDLYIWGKIKKRGEEIVIWGTDTGKFRDLVNAGKLPGKIKRKKCPFSS